MKEHYDTIDEKNKKINESMSLTKYTDLVNVRHETLLVLRLYVYYV